MGATQALPGLGALSNGFSNKNKCHTRVFVLCQQAGHFGAQVLKLWLLGQPVGFPGLEVRSIPGDVPGSF